MSRTTPRPFVLLSSRADDHLARRELDSFLRLSGLPRDAVEHVRMEQGPFTPLDLDRFAGVVVGGSPFTVTDPPESKSAVQVRVEAELAGLVRELVARDVPYLGLCYGIGVTALALGGVVDRELGEPVGEATIRLTEAAATDPVFGGLPERFAAFVGHKESCRRMPDGAVLLATNDACPVQAYRIGRRAYVTQFHPELEVETFVERIRAYASHGYFHPDELEDLVEGARDVDVSAAHDVLRRFVVAFADPA
ncbi:glutamine amidotransferase [Intrasporangium oryzae NRRL B-24470]|uniref:Glutamine amidotransferase n=1 Tax=Intrasporangium oryzae NRRL B-24470 TaxID=1386089 RepID=W9G5N0_9MICO|nr:glutamine amidotransferase [Intrasporangium oryzae]EWT01340.1 glutamine amidotransferase [Intrasporangium oryzae NRRL B-24470]